jgi:hypothetical protein
LFGRGLLLAILPQLRIAVRKRASKVVDFKPMITPFFDSLEVELRNPQSTISGQFDPANDPDMTGGFSAAVEHSAQANAAAAAAECSCR